MYPSALCGVQGDSSSADGGWGKAPVLPWDLARADGERRIAIASFFSQTMALTSAAVAEWNQNIAAEIAATIRAMFRRESLYAPRIFAHLYLTLAMTLPFRHLPA